MKRAIYLFVMAVMAIGFTACNKDDDAGSIQAEENLELRATTLGYPDVDAYIADVAIQCAAGHHQNCDILSDGTHCPCPYWDHSGMKHNGSHHKGNAGHHHGHRHQHYGSGYGN